jgi:hypothetical protein
MNTVTAYGGSGGSSGSGSHSGGSGGMPSPTMVPSVPVPMRDTTWDPVSNQRIQTLDPRVRKPATDFINDVDDWTNVKLRINEAYRSSAQQNAYYAKGRDSQGNIVDKSKVVTYAQGGESYHNYGRAVDVVTMTNGQPDWSKPITPDIASYGIKQGFEWGGNFPSTPIDKRDYPHFQMTFGQSVQELQADASQ